MEYDGWTRKDTAGGTDMGSIYLASVYFCFTTLTSPCRGWHAFERIVVKDEMADTVFVVDDLDDRGDEKFDCHDDFHDGDDDTEEEEEKEDGRARC